MLRIKLFSLFIAYAMVALVRPREMRKMLEAADRGALRNDREVQPTRPWSGHVPPRPMPEPAPYARERAVDAEADYQRRINEWRDWAVTQGLGTAEEFDATRASLECTLPPAGWRCTRRAGHDGPCAAVAK